MGRLAPPRAVALALLTLGILGALALGGWVATHGRIDYGWRGGPHALRRVTPVLLVAWLLLMAAGRLLGGERRRLALEALSRTLRQRGWIGALILASGLAITAVRFGAFTAAGSDPYGYVTQGILWSEGNPLQLLPPVALDAPVPGAAFCPLGYRPGAIPGTMVPTYAPGLPLQMAVLGFWTVPILAGLAVWLSYVIARHVTGPAASLVAACCVGTSPAFLFQSVQPMSDVPATAWWLAAVALALRGGTASALAAGLAASIAIVTRPNILPLVLPCGMYLALAPAQFWRRAMMFGAGLIPGVFLVAAVNHVLYGSALTSGYGSLAGYYSTSGVFRGAWTYIRWLWDTQSVLVFVLLALPFARMFHRGVPSYLIGFCWCSILFFGVLLASYAPFLRFEHWTFLRFLLPAIPLLLISAIALLSALMRHAPLPARAALLAFVVLMFPLAYVHTAAKADAFTLKRGFQQQFEESAAFAARQLPADAVFIGLSQTGSLRHYAHRLTMRYDLIDADNVTALTAYLTRRGYSPWAALDRDEAAAFDYRFRGTAWALDRHAMKALSPPGGRVVFLPLN